VQRGEEAVAEFDALTHQIRVKQIAVAGDRVGHRDEDHALGQHA
jgi:hypothetical protein